MTSLWVRWPVQIRPNLKHDAIALLEADEANRRDAANLIKRQRLHSPLVSTQPLSEWAAETMSKYSRLSGSSSDTNET